MSEGNDKKNLKGRESNRNAKYANAREYSQ